MILTSEQTKDGKWVVKSNYGNLTGKGDTYEEARDNCLDKVGKSIKKLSSELGFDVYID